MPDFPLLSGPRQGWLGGLWEGCVGLPLVGGVFGRAQRVRRKRFRARLAEDDALRQKVAASEPGRGFSESLTRWLARPQAPEKILPLEGAGSAPRVRCSVIINTVDRAGDLAITLADLGAQWSADLDELILVLGPTSDDSREKIARSGIPCRVIDCPERNLSVSRNLGLAAATGEFVAFLDDDASPCDGWLEALLEPLVRCPSAGASAGFALDGAGRRFLTRYVVADRLGRSTWWEEEEEAREHIAQAGPDRAFLTATGCNMAFRRDRVLTFGGFDPFYAYFLEETDLVLRLHEAGHPCLPCPGSVVRHRQGGNIARSPDASMASRQVIVRSQLHYLRKHGLALYPQAATEACIWQRVLSDLERIAWDHPTDTAFIQTAYLSGLSAGLAAAESP
jgi:GT2 family glycosyltransferase